MKSILILSRAFIFNKIRSCYDRMDIIYTISINFQSRCKQVTCLGCISARIGLAGLIASYFIGQPILAALSIALIIGGLAYKYRFALWLSLTDLLLMLIESIMIRVILIVILVILALVPVIFVLRGVFV
jgi:hypothetical protein